MPIYRLGEHAPQIDPTAWVADNAVIVGRVVIGPGASVWFGAVLRADNEPITVGAHCNIQESAVLHTDPGFPLTLEDGVSVGHQAMLHGCTVGRGSLIGIQAIVLNGAVIGADCLVGAGALVTENKRYPAGSLIVGAPAVVKRAMDAAQIAGLADSASGYVERAARYRASLVRVG